MLSRLCILALACFVLGCEDAGDGPFVGDLPIEDVSFSADIQPIFSRSCARAGCHIGGNPQAGLDLTSGAAYDEIVDVDASGYLGKRVAPGDPDASVLYRKILSDSSNSGFGTRMPQGGPYLSDVEQVTLRIWIAEGALDN
jgi:hypothetical protein